MSYKNATQTLDDRIALLESKKSNEFYLLKEQWQTTYESLKPVNLIKSTFRDVASSPEIKSHLVGNLIGLGTGYLSKKIMFGGTHNPIKKIIGTILQFAVSNFVGNKIETATTED